MSSDGDRLARERSSRRSFLTRAALLGAGAGVAPAMARAEDHGLDAAFAPDWAGSVARPVGEKLRELPSLDDFGPVGDGVTDDWAPVQAALDWAGQRPGARLRVPPRMFGLRRPLLAPDSIELLGELPGAGNAPLCGFRALPGFQSPYIQTYGTGGGTAELPVAALLISKGWTENSEFNRRVHLRDLFFDVDGQTDPGGGPVHGLLLANQQLDLHNLWIRSATGFGVWINTQRPDGVFMQAIVDNVLRRVWVRGAGIGGATFTTDDGAFRYGGFLIGALPGARDPTGGGEPALATDGILDYCTVAVGPESEIGCRGNGIHITQSAGWRVSACHLNGAGRHGIVLEKAFQTELSGNYLDGWGVDVAEGEGTFGCIWCNSMMALGDDVDGALIVAANRIRARAFGSTAGNDFVAIALRAGIAPTPHAIVMGNAIVKRQDAGHPFAVYDFGRSGEGELEAAVLGNVASGAARNFLRRWDEAAVRPRFTGNSFQHAAGAPAAGWHPAGLRIENTRPEPGGWHGWVSIAGGEPGTWRGYGRIEA